ncbi:MAG: CHAD domain-containing protein [Chthoniobacterales bacterium]|nr:CHAD domain-containing protein [Chthoniobacterales bacterium]
MSYELRTGETFGRGARRSCRREIARAIEWSQRPADGELSPVHQTRKHLKKARAALRLLSPVVGEKKFASMEKKLKKVAKLLSEMRDAEVRFHTVRQLMATFHLEKDHVLDETETLLGFELESFLAASGDWQGEVAQRLRRLRIRIGDWNTEELNCKQVRWVVQQTYDNGVQALREALDRPTAENFHIFRKAAKELTYQLCLLAPIDRPFLEPHVEALKILSEHLGNAHDLAFLGERLRKLETGAEERSTARAFFELIGLREKELQLRAATLAEKFYAERVTDFGKRISRRLAGWEEQQAGTISLAQKNPRFAGAMNGQYPTS